MTLHGVGETFMVGLLFAVAALTYAVYRLRVDLERTRERLYDTRDQIADLRREVERLSSRTFNLLRAHDEAQAEFRIASKPDEEARPSAWERLVAGEDNGVEGVQAGDGHPSPKAREEAR